jgi:hypothetical protein
MTSTRAENAKHSTKADTSEAVDAFMMRLDHPHKAAIESLRKIIVGAAPGIREGVKWNAPSFRTTEYFATTNLREKDGIGLILHVGSKVKKIPPGGLAVPDPEKMLKWLARDRAMVVFKDGKDLARRKAGLAALVRGWIAGV